MENLSGFLLAKSHSFKARSTTFFCNEKTTVVYDAFTLERADPHNYSAILCSFFVEYTSSNTVVTEDKSLAKFKIPETTTHIHPK